MGSIAFAVWVFFFGVGAAYNVGYVSANHPTQTQEQPK
jgi:hypothetical protein